MANERLSRALMSMGEDLGRMAEVSLTRERDRADRIHRASLRRLAENRADARQKRSLEARATEAEADRKLTISENEKDRALEAKRLSAQERRAIEREANERLAVIDDRVITLQDQLREGMLTPEAQKAVETELAELQNARSRIRYLTMEHLASAGDSRYADQDARSRYLEAGYSPKQVEALLSIDAQEGGGKETGEDESGAGTPAPYTSSLTPEQRQRRTEIWAENPDLSYAEVEALADKNPDAINADEIIQRPPRRRRRGMRLFNPDPERLEEADSRREAFRGFLTDKLKFLMEPGGVPGRAEALQRPDDFYAQFDEDFFERRGKGSP